MQYSYDNEHVNIITRLLDNTIHIYCMYIQNILVSIKNNYLVDLKKKDILYLISHLIINTYAIDRD